MRMTTRKAPWPLPRWATFCEQLRDLRTRMKVLATTFPETPGLKPSHVKGLMRAHERFVCAMIGVENVLERQHHDQAGDVIRFIHGPEGTDVLDGCRGRVRKDAPILTREQWVEQGREVKAIQAGITALMMELQETAGATRAYVDRFHKADRALDLAKCRLDALVYSQHRGWKDFMKVFYGPTDADLA